MRVFGCPQGSPDWFRVRRGVITASEVDAIVTPDFKPRTGEGVKTFICQKVAERLMRIEEGESRSAPSWAADQGQILETLAIPWFEFETGIKVERVGFCLSDDGRIGCSPDGLIGEDSGIETKCPQPKAQVRYLIDGAVPKEYLAQVHMSLLVTGRETWRFVAYSQDLPRMIVKVDRDESILDKLRDAVYAVVARIDDECAKVDAMNGVLQVGGSLGGTAAHCESPF
jgi:predicted phage-related endonuclease